MKINNVESFKHWLKNHVKDKYRESTDYNFEIWLDEAESQDSPDYELSSYYSYDNNPHIYTE